MTSRREFALGAAATVAHASSSPWHLPARRPYKTVDLAWVPMKDGVRMAIRLWIPEGAEQKPVPAVLEYIPYGRMTPGTTLAAEILAPYGIAFVRPDVRGSGDSEGTLTGEYLQQQLDDAITLIAWLAAQPWCNGSVGARGNSWGGFAALQIAAMRPKALKAIMTHCASDNRYTDDAHYVGGVLSPENFSWGMLFQTIVASPPDPAFVGKGWREMWMKRLAAVAAVPAQWAQHQRYDAFWQQGSVQMDYSRIQCPVYVGGGQVDPYRNFIPRMLTSLKVPHKGLMGPWTHGYPYNANPGPGLEWAVEEVRWWRHWLIGENTGIMEEPVFRAYMDTQTPAEVWPADVPGRWVSEDRWPSPRIQPATLFLNDKGLAAKPQTHPGVRKFHSQETLGLTKAVWMPLAMPRELPAEQTPDDHRSSVFDSAPLETDMEILGNPVARLRLSSNQPVSRIALRLNEVTPEGKSWNVTWALLNLTHRESDAKPSPLQPGQIYDVDVSCYFTAHRFKKGNRIRLAVSESLWPMVWPSPHPVELSLSTGVSVLTLPIRPRETVDQTPAIPLIRDKHLRDPAAGAARAALAAADAQGFVTVADPQLGTKLSTSIREGDPNSCIWKGESKTTMKREGSEIVILSSFQLTSTPNEFKLTESLNVTESKSVVADRKWQQTIARDSM